MRMTRLIKPTDRERGVSVASMRIAKDEVDNVFNPQQSLRKPPAPYATGGFLGRILLQTGHLHYCATPCAQCVNAIIMTPVLACNMQT